MNLKVCQDQETQVLVFGLKEKNLLEKLKISNVKNNMTKKLPIIIYKKKRCTVDFRLGELRCGRRGEPLKSIKFTEMPEGVNSKIKKKLRGLRSKTWRSDYIKGIDD